MTQENRQSSDGKQEGTSAGAQVQQPAATVSMEDFRKFQSTKDREVAEARKAAEDALKKVEELQLRQEELIQDPAKRAELKQERIEAQLNAYKKREELESQKRWFITNYGVPAEVVAEATDAGDTTLRVLNWQKEQAAAAAASAAKSAKDKENETVEEEGGNDVSLTPGTPPDKQRLSVEQVDKQIAALRDTALGGGNAGDRARLEILKLQAQRQRTRQPGVRV